MPQTIFKHKILAGFFLASFLFVASGFFWAIVALRAAGSQLVLHFNDIAGITAIGGLGLVEFMGVFGILVALVNGAIAFEFESRSPFFARLVAALTLLFSVLLFVGFASIIGVN